MTIGFLFWLIWVLCVVFGFWGAYPQRPPFVLFAFPLALAAMLFLLGWRAFGFVIQG